MTKQRWQGCWQVQGCPNADLRQWKMAKPWPIKLVAWQATTWLAVSRRILETVLSRMPENHISALTDQPFYHNVQLRY